MKIGFFTGVYFPRKDGVCYTVKTWKQELERRGHKTFVIYPSAKEHAPREREIPVKSLSDPMYYGHKWPVPLGTRSFPDIDIVHCHSPGLLGIMGRYYAWKQGIPSIFTFHTPLEEYIPQVLGRNPVGSAAQTIFTAADQKYLSTFDEVTTNTGRIRNRDINPVKIPAGVDTEFFYPRNTEGFLDKEGQGQNPVLGYCGRISEEKNLDLLVRFAEEVEATLIVAGEGRYKNKLKQEAGPSVVFRDYIDRENLPKFYSAIDCFVHASKNDTFSISSVEATACGTPVLAPDVHPFDKIIRSGRNGEKYEMESIEDMKEKYRDIKSNDYSPKPFSQQYSVKDSINQLEKLYKTHLDSSDSAIG